MRLVLWLAAGWVTLSAGVGLIVSEARAGVRVTEPVLRRTRLPENFLRASNLQIGFGGAVVGGMAGWTGSATCERVLNRDYSEFFRADFAQFMSEGGYSVYDFEPSRSSLRAALGTVEIGGRLDAGNGPTLLYVGLSLGLGVARFEGEQSLHGLAGLELGWLYQPIHAPVGMMAELRLVSLVAAENQLMIPLRIGMVLQRARREE